MANVAPTGEVPSFLQATGLTPPVSSAELSSMATSESVLTSSGPMQPKEPPQKRHVTEAKAGTAAVYAPAIPAVQSGGRTNPE